MRWVEDDGGRKAAGYRGQADDCVARSIAIAMDRPYKEVYDALNDLARGEKYRRGRVGIMAATGRGSSARTGVFKETYTEYLRRAGWVWTPTMLFGQGCRVHLKDGELPGGRLVVVCSRHLTAVIDGVVHDTHDPARGGTRCVYGFFQKGD